VAPDVGDVADTVLLRVMLTAAPIGVLVTGFLLDGLGLQRILLLMTPAPCSSAGPS
jgi:hypothetical protein